MISSRVALKEAVHELIDSPDIVDTGHCGFLLKKCIEFKALDEGKSLHFKISTGIYSKSSYLNNLLALLYGKCRCMNDARQVFDSLAENRNSNSWNILITAYAQNGYLFEAKSLFDACKQKTTATWNAMLTALNQSNQLDEASKMFNAMEQRDLVTWNIMLAGYAQNGKEFKALEMFGEMDLNGVKPNNISFITVLDACERIRDLRVIEIIFGVAREMGWTSDLKVGTAAVSAYGRCGSVEDAREIFDKMPATNSHVAMRNALLAVYLHHNRFQDAKVMFDAMPLKNRISWNCMMLAFGRSGLGREVFQLFKCMDLEGVPPDSASFANVLNTCTTFQEGELVHRCVFETGHASHLTVATALVDMYGKCGCLEKAKAIFDEIKDKDVVLWNAMITAYACNHLGHHALSVFRAMDLEGMKLNESSFVNIIDACTSITARAEGTLIHNLILEESDGFKLQGKVVNALVNMYARCGDLAQAQNLFEQSLSSDVVLWNAMIGAYAEFGYNKLAVDLFHEMLNAGVCPSAPTFTSILAACSREGSLENARDYFVIMFLDCGLGWNSEHFHCLVDVLCRAGKLKEAQELLNSMPYQASYPGWSSLISACGSSERNQEIVKEVATNVECSMSKQSGLFVNLSKALTHL